MPQPVVVDVVVGIGGERCGFRVETMAQLHPHEFVAQLSAFTYALLWPQSPEASGESNKPSACEQGLVGSGGGAVAAAAAPEPPSDLEARRRKAAAEAM